MNRDTGKWALVIAMLLSLLGAFGRGRMGMMLGLPGTFWSGFVIGAALIIGIAGIATIVRK